MDSYMVTLLFILDDPSLMVFILGILMCGFKSEFMEVMLIMLVHRAWNGNLCTTLAKL